jgi:hypothetical protein
LTSKAYAGEREQQARFYGEMIKALEALEAEGIKHVKGDNLPGL